MGKIFHKVNKIKESKLRWFQIRINNRIVATRVMLADMGNSNDTACTFCNESLVSVHHVFWECPHTGRFGGSFSTSLRACKHTVNTSLSIPLVLFGYDKNVKTSTVLIVAKLIIFTS